MLANFHTHTTFCDGKNTPEEIVVFAIEKGFDTIGFSGHGYTDFDLRYCMKDTEGYILTVNKLKEKYKDSIRILLGVEEDAFYPVDRSRFDYVIGSSHYFKVNGCFYPIDSGADYFKKCLSAFGSDTEKMANAYYTSFCEYILRRRPSIIGHFDLITKYEEAETELFLNDKKYLKTAGDFAALASRSGCLFEVNTGAIARGLRTAPYPCEALLYRLKREGAKLVLSSDSHKKETLDFWFPEAKKYLFDIGFRELYTIGAGADFEKEPL